MLALRLILKVKGRKQRCLPFVGEYEYKYTLYKYTLRLLSKCLGRSTPSLLGVNPMIPLLIP